MHLLYAPVLSPRNIFFNDSPRIEVTRADRAGVEDRGLSATVGIPVEAARDLRIKLQAWLRRRDAMPTSPDTADSDPPPPEPGPRRITLWCGVCGRCESFTRAQMAEYLRGGWPTCHGVAMGFYEGLPPETK
jgi:hypothetical protein